MVFTSALVLQLVMEKHSSPSAELHSLSRSLKSKTSSMSPKSPRISTPTYKLLSTQLLRAPKKKVVSVRRFTNPPISESSKVRVVCIEDGGERTPEPDTPNTDVVMISNNHTDKNKPKNDRICRDLFGIKMSQLPSS